MKKKIISIVAIAALLLTSVCIFGSLGACTSKINGTNIEYEVVDGEIHITGYSDSTLVDTVEIPPDIDGVPVTVIEDFAIVNAETLVTIKIGKNVKEIGTWAFSNNRSMNEFIVDEENEYFTAIDGVLFSKDKTTLICYPTRKGASVNAKLEVEQYADYNIPAGTTVIREKAFYKCIYLRNVTIPEGVTRIEEKAFHRCEALNAVVLPSTLTFIGKDAFAYCDYEGFNSIVIPASVTQIDEYAFYNCTNLKDVTVLAPKEAITLGKKWYPTDNGRTLKGLNLDEAYID